MVPMLCILTYQYVYIGTIYHLTASPGRRQMNILIELVVYCTLFSLPALGFRPMLVNEHIKN